MNNVTEIQFDPRAASIVLISTSNYRSEALPDLSAAANNVTGLKEALTDPVLGLISRDRCKTVIDPDRPSQVSRMLRSSAANADMVLVYYAGHGLLSPRDDLYLGLTGTEPGNLAASALPYQTIRETILDSPARHRVVILDCCFSGKAAMETMSDPGSQIISHAQVEGTYVLTAASSYGAAFAPTGGQYTAFTNELIQILTAGIANAPEFLSLSSIFAELRRRLRAKGLPEPNSRSRGPTGELYLVRNAAFTFVGAGEIDQNNIRTSRAPGPAPVDLRLAAPQWVDPGFAHEATSGRDMLGIRKDAAALAVLIASSSLNPPLAVGLYGNWGSGKTFFMKTLDREIRRLTDQNSPGCCGNVASVWFNAWQYAEGNLWASLTHHIFLSLHDEGSAPERVLNDALTTVQGVCDARADASVNVQRSEQAVKRAQDDIAELQKRIEQARTSAAKVRGRDLLDAISVDDQLRESLNDASKDLGLPEAGTSAREVIQAASDLRSAVESWRALSIAGPWWRTPLALGIVVAAVAGGVSIVISALLHARLGTASPIVGEAGQLLALIGGVAAWVTRQSSLARSLMRPAERIQKQVNARIAEQESRYRAESAAAIEDLNRAGAELISARRQLADAQDRETAARFDLDRLTGPRLLERYLSERAASSEYGQYLGAVALAHRDLLDLAAYLETAATDSPDSLVDEVGTMALELNDEELKSLRLVAPLVDVSPRRAKRFLNIYRIAKARALMEPTTYELLTDEMSQPDAAIALLAATALAIGLPNYFPAAMDSADHISEVGLRRWLEQQRQIMTPGTQEMDRLTNFLSSDKIPVLAMKDLIQWLPIVRRFAWPVQPTFAQEVTD